MSANASLASAEGSEGLAEHVARLDAARFVGRQDVLSEIDRILESTGPARVVFLHGPGGIGKSALLREIGRRMRRAGRTVRRVDGRLLAPSPEALVAACSAGGRPPQVVLIDSFELISALASVLRDDALPKLPADAIVVVAGRQRPAALWFRDGWEHVVRDVALSPLTDDEADELLAHYDLDASVASRSRSWAKGSPLALHVAAASVTPEGIPATQDLADAVAARLVGDDLADIDAEVLAVAAIARAVDEQLVAEALPHRDTREAYRRFRQLSVLEPYGTQVALHDLVREALGNDLRRRDKERYRQFVCRIADRLHARVVDGDHAALENLIGLIEDPFVRGAYSRGRGATFQAGRPEAGDADRLAALLGAAGTSWWAGVERFFTEAPELVTVARAADGQLVGYSIATTPEGAPAWTHSDPVLGPHLEHARLHRPGEKAMIWRDFVDLTDGEGGASPFEVAALLNFPAHMISYIPTATFFYGAIPSDDEEAIRLRTRIGAERIASLTITDGERILHSYAYSSGPGGQVAKVREMIYVEQGVPLPPQEAKDATDANDESRAATTEEQLRSALLHFHDPVALAESPFARPGDLASRAESVRIALREAADAVFGQSEPEQAMRRMIDRAYFDPQGGHRRAMAEQHLARSSYFRRLSEAIARMSAAIR